MAFKLDESRLNGLLEKGLVSTEFAERVSGKSAAQQAKAIDEVAKPETRNPTAEEMDADFSAQIAEQKRNATLLASNEPFTGGSYTPSADGSAPATPAPEPAPAAPPGLTQEQEVANARSLEARQLELDTPMNATFGGADAVPNAPPQLTMNGTRQITKAGGTDPSNVAGGAPQLTLDTPQTGVPFIKPSEQPTPKPAAGGGSSGPSGARMMLNAQNAATGQRAVLGQQATDVQMREDQSVAAAAAANAERYAEQMRVQDERNKEQFQYLQKDLDQLQADAIAQGNQEVDPQRGSPWADNKSTGSKIMSAVGLFLGAFGQAGMMAGGNKNASNQAMDVINQNIERDIKAQEYNIKNKGNSISERRGIYAQKLQTYGDERLAYQASMIHGLQDTENRVKAIVAGNASDKTQIRGQELLVGLEEERAKREAQFKIAAEQRAAAVAAQAAARREKDRVANDAALRTAWQTSQDANGNRPPLETFMQNPQAYKSDHAVATAAAVAKEKGSGEPALEVLDSDGNPTQVQPRNKEAGTKIAAAAAARDTLRGQIKRAQELRAQYGGETFPTAAKKEMETLTNDMITTWKDIKGLGALSGPDLNLAQTAVPDLTDWNIIGRDTVAAQLDQLTTSANQAVDSAIRANKVAGTTPKTEAGGGTKLDAKPNK